MVRVLGEKVTCADADLVVVKGSDSHRQTLPVDTSLNSEQPFSFSICNIA